MVEEPPKMVAVATQHLLSSSIGFYWSIYKRLHCSLYLQKREFREDTKIWHFHLYRKNIKNEKFTRDTTLSKNRKLCPKIQFSEKTTKWWIWIFMPKMNDLLYLNFHAKNGQNSTILKFFLKFEFLDIKRKFATVWNGRTRIFLCCCLLVPLFMKIPKILLKMLLHDLGYFFQRYLMIFWWEFENTKIIINLAEMRDRVIHLLGWLTKVGNPQYCLCLDLLRTHFLCRSRRH